VLLLLAGCAPPVALVPAPALPNLREKRRKPLNYRNSWAGFAILIDPPGVRRHCAAALKGGVRMSATVAAMPPVHVTVTGTPDKHMLASKLSAAFNDAMAGIGKLDERAFQVPGMSGKKFRMCLNNLIGSLDDARYLEIGVHIGGTLCSAISQNRVTVTAIDNWSLYGRGGIDCFFNVAKFRGVEAKISVLERDFREIDYATIGKFNVYFFDGPHEEQDQYDGATMPQPAWDPTCILIVDDWNWDKVRNGTLRGLRDSGVTLEYSIALRTSLDGSTPAVQTTFSDWHNGLFLAVVSKRAA
jgi:hypothetical protein